MNQTKLMLCPECKSQDTEKIAVETPVFEGDSDSKQQIGIITAQYRCKRCNYEFGEVESDEVMKQEACTHDGFTVWIVETRKQYYQRNEYTGQLEEASSRAHESDWSTITCECGDCGKDLDKDEIDRVYEIKGWKPKSPVWKIRAKVTRTTDETHYAFGKTVKEAMKNIVKGESHLYANYPLSETKPELALDTASLFKVNIRYPVADPECPDPQACCFYCDKYVPKAKAKETLGDGIVGVCYEGGYTEMSNPFQLLCKHEDGWCTGYKKKEIPYETSIPTIKEVTDSPIFKEVVLDELDKQYSSPHYRRDLLWHVTDYREQFLNVHITDAVTNIAIDHWKFAFVKVNGVIENV